MTSIRGVIHLASTVVAQGGIRGDHCAGPLTLLGLGHPKAGVAEELDLLDFDLVEPSQGREFGLESLDKGRGRRGGSLDFRGGALRIVPDHADQPELGGDAVDGGSEADSLNRPAAPNPESIHECCLASNRLAMRSHHESMPSPVVDETTRMTPAGLSEEMWPVTVSRSNGT